MGDNQKTPRNFRSRDFLETLGKRVVLEFSDSNQATTPSLIGDSREESIRSSLDSVLGNALSVGEGVIFDVNGNASAQQDIVITEALQSLCFRLANSKSAAYWPCETTVACGEVKSSIGNRELHDIITKCTSVKNLNRKQVFSDNISGENVSCYRSFGSSVHFTGTQEEQFNPEIHSSDQIFFFAVAGS